MLKFIVDNVFTQTVVSSARDHELIDACLSYQVQNASAIKRKMLRAKPNSSYWRSWTGYKSFYMKDQNAFFTGLLSKVTLYLRQLNVPFEVIDRRTRPSQVPEGAISSAMLKGITLYPFQVRTIKEAIQIGRGVIQLPTGAGKTEISIAITKAIGVPTLFLTNRVNLLHQTAQRYATRYPELKSRIGLIGDSIYEPNFITLATVQTLQSMLKRQPAELLSVLSKFQAIFIDEAHRSGSDQFTKPGIFCKNAFYRFGMTATPFMTKDSESNLNLLGLTGPICSRVSNSELIELGVLARPYFKFFTIDEPQLTGFSKWQDVYERGIVHHGQRNKFIVSQATKLAGQGKKILTIVQRRDHGSMLRDMMKAQGMAVEYIDGEASYPERAKVLKWLSNKGQAIIATNIFDEGVDVRDIGVVILAAGTKAAPALFQRTGRAMRKKAEDNYAIVIDFIDKQHPMLLAHSMRRYELVKNEKGFIIL